MTRLEKIFKQTSAKKKILVTYTVAGDPSLKTSKKILDDLVSSGADILEIGVPFSDPMSEGPVIQKAHERALKKNIEFKDILNICKQIRKKNSSVPIVLMGYMNSFLSLKNKLAKELFLAGVDGVIVVDLPYDESKSFFENLRQEDIDLIRLISPTTDSKRLKQMLASSSGYLYYVSLKGVTGANHLDIDSVAQRIPKIRETVRLPVGVGFGIRDANNVIANVPNIDMDDELKNRIIGEAKFLRALHYFNLVRCFGEVPLRLEPVEPGNDQGLPVSPIIEIYDAIITDLDYASIHCWGRNEVRGNYVNDLGRVTDTAANALLAKVYTRIASCKRTASEGILGNEL